MAKRTTSPDKIPLDPIFTIPEGGEDAFIYSREFDEIDFSTIGDDGFPAGTVDASEAKLAVPTKFSIVLPQKLRRGPGGKQRVDIVLNIVDTPGAINYEIQVVKI